MVIFEAMRWKMIFGFAFLVSSCIPTKDGNQYFQTWQNPILDGINPYGMKDFFVWSEEDAYYLVGSEYSDPFDEQTKGPYLYSAKNFAQWEKGKALIDHDHIADTAWYRDEWRMPEIIRIQNKYYLTFNSRNNTLRPYKKYGFGLAISDKLEGPYEVINKSAPLAWTNHGTIVEAKDGSHYLYYDMDGRFYIAAVDVAAAQLLSEPKEILGPDSLGDVYKYLDAPQITRVEDDYHMLFSQFYGGYVIRVFHMIANDAMGPWIMANNDPIYTFLEAEADLEVKMEYPESHGFAPPTQVVFSNQLFKGLDGQYYIAYHSSEKYSEPYLCIEPTSIVSDSLVIWNPKSENQTSVKE
ncbi:family 43 glycosylhydrolase [Reichenbachiella ulvae]|uniref:Family 43 glycosylhydrolase n=1 Tax=Reichenbachiella ulvae TaxID=2980104 RepID=A0ABT3D031_9BACT|nr:family 43 glycosylhydrolase [Reichenbachiella ulvae]MCV9389306.1 family 43 glycosylhydrolase [Reichenbachiella ulvae]